MNYEIFLIIQSHCIQELLLSVDLSHELLVVDSVLGLAEHEALQELVEVGEAVLKLPLHDLRHQRRRSNQPLRRVGSDVVETTVQVIHEQLITILDLPDCNHSQCPGVGLMELFHQGMLVGFHVHHILHIGCCHAGPKTHQVIREETNEYRNVVPSWYEDVNQACVGFPIPWRMVNEVPHCVWVDILPIHSLEATILYVLESDHECLCLLSDELYLSLVIVLGPPRDDWVVELLLETKQLPIEPKVVHVISHITPHLNVGVVHHSRHQCQQRTRRKTITQSATIPLSPVTVLRNTPFPASMCSMLLGLTSTLNPISAGTLTRFCSYQTLTISRKWSFSFRSSTGNISGSMSQVNLEMASS